MMGGPSDMSFALCDATRTTPELQSQEGRTGCVWPDAAAVARVATLLI